MYRLLFIIILIKLTRTFAYTSSLGCNILDYYDDLEYEARGFSYDYVDPVATKSCNGCNNGNSCCDINNGEQYREHGTHNGIFRASGCARWACAKANELGISNPYFAINEPAFYTGTYTECKLYDGPGQASAGECFETHGDSVCGGHDSKCRPKPGVGCDGVCRCDQQRASTFPYHVEYQYCACVPHDQGAVTRSHPQPHIDTLWTELYKLEGCGCKTRAPEREACTQVDNPHPGNSDKGGFVNYLLGDMNSPDTCVTFDTCGPGYGNHVLSYIYNEYNHDLETTIPTTKVDDYGCKRCPSGTYSDSTDPNWCFDCPDGTYAGISCEGGWQGGLGQWYDQTCYSIDGNTNRGNTQCYTATKRCQKGEYATDVTTTHSYSDTTTCHKCPRGKYMEEDNHVNTECIQCQASDVANCDTCDLSSGSRCAFCCYGNSLVSQGNLQLCPADTYEDTYNAVASCKSCPAGRSQQTEGMNYCYCDAGYQLDGVNTYASSKSSACIPCPAGRYGALLTVKNSAFDMCEDCNVGTYSLAGQEACTDCLAGRYQDESASGSCKYCDPGFAQPNDGSSTCIQCAKGTYAGNSGHTECYDCPEGKFQDGRDPTQCVGCPIGRTKVTQFAVPEKLWSGFCGAGCNANRNPYNQIVNHEDIRTWTPTTTNKIGECIITCKENYAGRTSTPEIAGGVVDKICATINRATGFCGCSPCDPDDCDYDSDPHNRCCNPSYSHLCPRKIATYNTADTWGFGVSSVAHDSTDVDSVCESNSCGLGEWLGKHRVYNTNTCFQCPDGTYMDEDFPHSNTACKDCPSGKSSNDARDDCRDCPAPQTNQAGVCKGCPVGHYYKDGVCEDCPGGKYADEIGLTECKVCAAGKGGKYEGGTFYQWEKNLAKNKCKHRPTKERRECLRHGYATSMGSNGLNVDDLLNAADYDDTTICQQLADLGKCAGGWGNDNYRVRIWACCPAECEAAGTWHPMCSIEHAREWLAKEWYAGMWDDYYAGIRATSGFGTKYPPPYHDDNGNLVTPDNEHVATQYYMYRGTQWTPDGESEATSCVDCPSDRISVDGQCAHCPAGEGKIDGTCTTCPIGKVRHDNGASCEPCNTLGEYQDETGQEECKICPDGGYITKDNVICEQCPASMSQNKFSEGDNTCMGDTTLRSMTVTDETSWNTMDKTNLYTHKTTHNEKRHTFKAIIFFIRNLIRSLINRRMKMQKQDMVISTSFKNKLDSSNRNEIDVVMPKEKPATSDDCTFADIDTTSQTTAFDIQLIEVGDIGLVCKGQIPITKLELVSTDADGNDQFKYYCYTNSTWQTGVDISSDSTYDCNGKKYYVN